MGIVSALERRRMSLLIMAAGTTLIGFTWPVIALWAVFAGLVVKDITGGRSHAA